MNSNGLANRQTVYAFVVVAGALLAMPLTALGAAHTPSPSALAMTDSLAKVCEAVDAGVAADLKQKAAQMAQGLTEEELVQLRNSAEYQSTYQSITNSLGSSEQEAKKTCSAAPAAR